MNSKEARFLMYRTAEDEVAVNALVKDDTIWLNQKGICQDKSAYPSIRKTSTATTAKV